MKKITKIFIAILVITLFNAKAFSNPFILLDSLSLANTKYIIENGTASEKILTAYTQLIKEADKLLKINNPTVMDKTLLPPTGNKHDYLSISRYWWPNPKTTNGLPWVRQDGKTNPDTQTDTVDRKRLGLMGKGVWTLSLAYYFTSEEKYAKKAVSMIKTWFLNPETLMNPHLEFAQSVPGNPNKRPTGILDGRSIVMFVPDAINLISNSRHWNINLHTKMNAWFMDYLNWLTKSELGIKGSKQQNNHGSWYKFQVASLALYLNNKPLVKKMVKLAQNSLDNMLDNQGGQIHELTRSRSFFYSCFNLQALANIAVLGEKVGMDMWQFTSDSEKSLFLAINYLTPVVTGKEWKHTTLKAIDFSGLVPILSKIPAKYNSQEYKNVMLEIMNIFQRKGENDKLFEFWLLNNYKF